LKEIEEKKTKIKLPFKSSPQAVRAVHDGDQCRTHFIANGRNLVKMRKKKTFSRQLDAINFYD
jgi:c-di-GMP-binding flagellar brake protein YcgR